MPTSSVTRAPGYGGGVEVTEVTDAKPDRVRVTYTDRSDGTEHRVDADYVLGCDGANSITRRRIGSRMHDLGFEQRWLVVDVATSADIDQWEGVHQVCDPQRAATYMRIGETRYRWEFQLLQSESAGDYATLDSLLPLFRPWVDQVPADDLTLVRVTEYTFRAQLADRWRRGRVFLLGDAAHLTPPAVHRAGHGCGIARRDEPGVEAGGGGARLRLARGRAGHLRAGTEAPTPGP